MKESDSHLQLKWSFDLGLSVPIDQQAATDFAGRVVIAACVVALALGLAPLAGLLLAGP